MVILEPVKIDNINHSGGSANVAPLLDYMYRFCLLITEGSLIFLS